MKPRAIIIVGVAALALIAVAILVLQNAPLPTTDAGAPVTPLAVVPETTPTPAAPSLSARQSSAPPVRTTPGEPEIAPPPLAEWEMKIDEVLNSKGTETETAQILINMLPTLPLEGQTQAAQHITNLILDPEYQRIAPLLRNPSLPQEVHDVLFTDLMNRSDPVKMPSILEVARIPNHPYHEEALTDLQLFLEQDNGNNWSKWDASVKEYLRKQKAEQAALEAPGTAVPAP